MRKRLSTPELRFGRSNRASCGQHGSVSFEHRETGILICEPSEGGKRNETICPNDHESFQTVTYTRKPDSSTLRANTILDFKVATLHSHFDSVAKKRENATSANRGFAGKVGLR
ncbi:MAG TPA: hypothetical protein VMS18_11485 [Candidatus Binatia bacterium]|nr:hypothetical protein [Candidatus Binatia bacterium]